MRRVLRANNRFWVISALLVALVVRALIPAGFMPATDRPFSFQICPDGFPAALLKTGTAGLLHLDDASPTHAHHHHGDGATAAEPALDPPSGASSLAGEASENGPQPNGPGHHHSSVSSEHCVFAAAAGTVALAFAPTFSAPAITLGAPEFSYVSPAVESRRFHLPQPRGPPSLS
jgi:hypothetical protein